MLQGCNIPVGWAPSPRHSESTAAMNCFQHPRPAARGAGLKAEYFERTDEVIAPVREESAGDFCRSNTTSRSPTTPWTIASRRRAPDWAPLRLLLGHHYQRDEVIRFADSTGDSTSSPASPLKPTPNTSSSAASISWPRAPTSSAAPRSAGHPARLDAGCSMADMAEICQVEDCWESLERLGLTARSPAHLHELRRHIKAFCGEHGGLVCTSSNARAAFEWAFARVESLILFLPDQHLGRNTGI